MNIHSRPGVSLYSPYLTKFQEILTTNNVFPYSKQIRNYVFYTFKGFGGLTWTLQTTHSVVGWKLAPGI